MQRIADLLKNNCCVFIWAGIPKALGFPLWSKLAKDLIDFAWSKKNDFDKKRLNFSIKEELEDRVNKGEQISVITYCRDLFREINQEREYQVRIISWLHDETKYKLAKDSPVYIQLKILLKDALVLQTNIDRSIQEYCDLAFYVNTNLPSHIQKHCLVYLHGIITDPSSWVMTRDEYNNFYQRNSSFVSFVQGVFQSYNVLFLGYSLNDKEILDQIARVKGSGKQYILVLAEKDRDKSLNTVLENELKHYDIVVVRYSVEQEGYDAFVAFLEQINLLLSTPVKLGTQEQDRSRINE